MLGLKRWIDLLRELLGWHAPPQQPPRQGEPPPKEGRPGEELGPPPGQNPSLDAAVAHISACSRRAGLPERIGLAIAWTESRMRQFSESGEPLRHVNRNAHGRAVSNDWGMMQLNDRVWGSRFDLERVKHDWRYNVAAGIEIASEAYRRAQAQKEPDLASATYAGYNAGYDHVDRYRKQSDIRDRRFRQVFESQPWKARLG